MVALGCRNNRRCRRALRVEKERQMREERETETETRDKRERERERERERREIESEGSEKQRNREREWTVECVRSADAGARTADRGSSRERDGRRETRGSCCVELSSYVGPSRCRRRSRRRAANRRPTPPLPYAKGCRRRPAASQPVAADSE